MKELSHREIQLALLEILQAVDAYCRREGLRYSLAYGTLIGAVRHRGFIPWDDDIDLLMPRPDFERFISGFGKEPGSRFQVLYDTRGEEARFVNFFAKVHDTTTRSIEWKNRRSFRFGLNIDIFPVDGKPTDPKEQYLHQKELGHLVHRIFLAARPIFPIRLHDPLPAKIAAHLRGVDYWRDRCVALMKSYDFETSPYCGTVSIARNGVRDIYPRELFEEYAPVSFEGLEFPAFKNYDLFLRQQFGDYMQLPPEKDRRTHKLEVYKLD